MSATGDERREAIYDFVVRHWITYQVPPSIRATMKVVGLKSTSTVVHHLNKLVEEGRLRKTPDYNPEFYVPEIRDEQDR